MEGLAESEKRNTVREKGIKTSRSVVDCKKIYYNKIISNNTIMSLKEYKLKSLNDKHSEQVEIKEVEKEVKKEVKKGKKK
jgi:hypothetical protein